MVLQKTHLSHFIPVISSTSDGIRIFAGLDEAFKLANKIFKHSSKSPAHPQLICYDTTFNIGQHYLSTVLAKNVELSRDPIFPIAFYIHDRKKKDDHQVFLDYVFKRLDINPNIPIVTDREGAITSFFLNREKTKDNHFCCMNHIVSDAKVWVRDHIGGGRKNSDNYGDSVKELAKSKSLLKYVKLKSENEKDWDSEFLNYFNKFLHNDLVKNMEQLDTEKFRIFDTQFVTNNVSESFHLAFKTVFDAESIKRTEHVLLSLYIYQADQLREFELAFDESGVSC